MNKIKIIAAALILTIILGCKKEPEPKPTRQPRYIMKVESNSNVTTKLVYTKNNEVRYFTQRFTDTIWEAYTQTEVAWNLNNTLHGMTFKVTIERMIEPTQTEIFNVNYLKRRFL
jgi:PBP1b-binding outer membrane lipoprotein LpoB